MGYEDRTGGWDTRMGGMRMECEDMPYEDMNCTHD